MSYKWLSATFVALVLYQFGLVSAVNESATGISGNTSTNTSTPWYVSHSSNVCILAQFKAELVVEYVTKDHGLAKGKVEFSKDAEVNKMNSACNETIQILQLDFWIGESNDSIPAYSHVKLHFGKSADKVFLWQIEFELNNLKSVFPDAKHDVLIGGLANQDLFETTTGHSYFCNRPSALNFRGTEISFSDVQLEAFRNSTDYNFSEADNCEGTRTSIRIGVIIGCIIGVTALIIIATVIFYAWKKNYLGYGPLSRLNSST